ncbi:uncharacterized protein LOC100200141 [Hydra vulgaris]|uniref:uncharacterized protein LOC100200141 n=1 Tax=Hydra vulgaris TaxID=6087 RepID=UPI000192471D|nr:uncharacterized protein LOC100200141 [Hydra vulgaris]
MFTKTLIMAYAVIVVAGNPLPYNEIYQRCCLPSPTCMNPCPPPLYPQQTSCCMPSPECSNPCYGSMVIQPQPAMPLAFRKSPKQPVVYAPLPGEIVFKLLQNWDPELLDNQSPSFQILEGNIRSAVQAVLGPSTQVTNIYFREGYVPGNPPSRPKTVAHMMVNGGSDAASMLEHAVTPDGSLGDGLKVYKDSFNAY